MRLQFRLESIEQALHVLLTLIDVMERLRNLHGGEAIVIVSVAVWLLFRSARLPKAKKGK